MLQYSDGPEHLITDQAVVEQSGPSEYRQLNSKLLVCYLRHGLNIQQANCFQPFKYQTS